VKVLRKQDQAKHYMAAKEELKTFQKADFTMLKPGVKGFIDKAEAARKKRLDSGKYKNETEAFRLTAYMMGSGSLENGVVPAEEFFRKKMVSTVDAMVAHQ
jgi:hypothetical protein